MLSLMFQAITWGMLLIFAGFAVFGLFVVGKELIRFYAREIEKLRMSASQE